MRRTRKAGTDAFDRKCKNVFQSCQYIRKLFVWHLTVRTYNISACKLKAKYAIILLIHVWLDSSQLTSGNNVIYSSFKYWIHFSVVFMYISIWDIGGWYVIDTSLSPVRCMPVLQLLSCMPEDRMENWIDQQLFGPYNARFTWYIRYAAGIH